MRALLAVALLGAVACTPDSVPFTLAFELERDTANYACEFASCEVYPMGCDVALSVRVVDADDESIAYLSACVPFDGGDSRVLCDVADVDLGSATIPNKMVKVQVGVWKVDAGDPSPCKDIDFDLQGKPAPPGPLPAFGGEAYFEVGSSPIARVKLGCVNPASVNTCINNGLTVRATVDDFDTFVPVVSTLEPGLDVAIGEPRFDTGLGRWVLRDVVELVRDTGGPTTTWTSTFESPFLQAACIEVTEQTIRATSTLRCERLIAAPTDELRLAGAFLDKQGIDLIELAIGPIPDTGLVVGQVVDSGLVPAQNVTITADPPATVLYLSEDLTSVVPGATATTSSGWFLSADADFETTWTATAGTLREVEPVLGGLVEDHVTVVMLQLEDTDVMP